MIKGIGASSGIVTGKAFVLPNWEWDLPEHQIDVSDLATEFERLYEGIRTSKSEIQHIKQEVSDVIGTDNSTIFDAHLAILDDPVFMNEIQGLIRRQYKRAEVAVKEAIDNFANMFDLLDDQYMKERALDIKDVGNRLLKHLIGKPDVTLPEDTQPFVLVAKELSPSQLAHLNPEHVIGLVTMVGGPASHSAIMARALGIPMVVGLESKLERPIQTGDWIIMDGETGEIEVNPQEEKKRDFFLRRQQWLQERNRLEELSGVEAVTVDGCPVELEVNINSIKELERALQYGISGVGLLRTEYLFMEKDQYPTEDEQYEMYRQALDAAGGRTVIVRTLDIGGDKQLDYLPFHSEEEENPVLGYRAIRIFLDHPELFKVQLRAVLRASCHGELKLMYPMIASLEELREANALLEECKRELERAGVPDTGNLKVGINIEVPAAAAIADLLAEEVDFFSIGTNDLIQYTLAADRLNEKIAYLYDPYQPSIMRMLQMITDAARAKGIEVSVCGEMAGDPDALPIWLGLGVSKLSMSVGSILRLKAHVLKTSAKASRELYEKVRTCKTAKEIKEVLGIIPSASETL